MDGNLQIIINMLNEKFGNDNVAKMSLLEMAQTCIKEMIDKDKENVEDDENFKVVVSNLPITAVNVKQYFTNCDDVNFIDVTTCELFFTNQEDCIAATKLNDAEIECGNEKTRIRVEQNKCANFFQ